MEQLGHAQKQVNEHRVESLQRTRQDGNRNSEGESSGKTSGDREDTHTGLPSGMNESVQTHLNLADASGSNNCTGNGTQAQGGGFLNRNHRDLRGLPLAWGECGNEDQVPNSVRRKGLRTELTPNILGMNHGTKRTTGGRF